MLNCGSDKISLDDTCSFDELGADGNGTVYFYSCHNCGADIEVWVPEKEDEEECYYERSE